jgi:hypothetical protein
MNRLLFAMAVCFTLAIPARQLLDARQEPAAPGGTSTEGRCCCHAAGWLRRSGDLRALS